MKPLKKLIQDVAVIQVIGSTAIQPTSLCIDSREVKKGGIFFAQKGTQVDGHQYIPQAIKAGAAIVVCEQLPETVHPNICFVVVADAMVACGQISAAFYNFPSKSLAVVGVTGTNGKTTVATLLFKLFQSKGYNCGLISTVGNQINNQKIPTIHTTPDAIHLQSLLAKMRDTGCTHVFMEVSSHAIHQKRISGIVFTGGIFTNITHDHLDYHKTFEEYIRVKKKFFDDLPKTAFALSNIDEKRGLVMLQNTKATKKYYALRKPADFKGKILANNLNGLQMMIGQQEVHFLMSGLFNAYNLLAAYGAAVTCGMSASDALTGLSVLKGAPGRFETYYSTHEKVLGIIDYAHTPDALLNILTTIQQFDTVKRIITVVGCGGDRDKTKRPEMAEIACKHSNRVILTSDNPRTEDPNKILDDMEKGLSAAALRKVLRIVHRKEAIKTACSLATTGDVVLVAGKGHETYQEINGVKHDFDDKQVLLETFELLGK